MEKELLTLEEAFEHTFLDPKTVLGAIFYAAIIFTLALLISRALRVAAGRFTKPGKHGAVDTAALSFLTQLGRILTFALAFSLYAHLIPQLRTFGTALLASVSVASIVLGLAAQNTLGNLVAGISLLIYRPFRAGDWLEISTPNGVELGFVENLTLGYTILNTLDQRRIVVPNSKLASEVAVNRSMIDPHLALPIYLTLSFGSDADRARQILVEIAKTHHQVEDVVECRVSALTSAGAQLLLRVICLDQLVGREVTFDILEEARRRFDVEGIENAYTYRNRSLKQKHEKLKKKDKKKKDEDQDSMQAGEDSTATAAPTDLPSDPSQEGRHEAT